MLITLRSIHLVTISCHRRQKFARVHFDVLKVVPYKRPGSLQNPLWSTSMGCWDKTVPKKKITTLVCVSLLTNKKMYACYKFFVSFQYIISFFSAFSFLCNSTNIVPMNKNETVLERSAHVEEGSINIVCFLLRLLRDRLRRA